MADEKPHDSGLFLLALNLIIFPPPVCNPNRQNEKVQAKMKRFEGESNCIKMSVPIESTGALDSKNAKALMEKLSGLNEQEASPCLPFPAASGDSYQPVGCAGARIAAFAGGSVLFRGGRGDSQPE